MADRTTFKERARQEVINRCVEMFERLCRSEAGRLPDELHITMRARWPSVSVETDALVVTPKPIVIPKPIRYNTDGQLTGKIRDYEVAITQYDLRFIPVINGKQLSGLTMSFVEGELGISVRRKRSGGGSETLSRAVWRHLADRYNEGDPAVHYERATE
jgi:hypothetical protein